MQRNEKNCRICSSNPCRRSAQSLGMRMQVISVIIATVRFGSEGVGTFIPGEGTNPHIGETGQLERVEEIRVETIIPGTLQRKVIKAMLEPIHMKKWHMMYIRLIIKVKH